ncbi:hypothetical protein [Microtetraspora fusca]|uniref:hypothetical protein n=1 Tax=Microtetraspora fusca TaxID=1997 RepID=UPI00083486DA|nr:hypothetical protein [Microtetraspora fusca]
MDGDATGAAGRPRVPRCGTRPRTIRPRVTALLAVALALTGCTSAAGTAKPGVAAPATSPSTGGRQAIPDLATTPGRPVPSTEPTGGSLDPSLIRTYSDYDPAPSPEALAGRTAIVAGGVVDGWQRGPTLGVLPGDPPVPYVLMRVRITHPLKGVRTTPSLSGGMMFIEFDRAHEESVADFAKRIPAGVRVLVFGEERPPYEMGVRSPGHPLPDGAKVMGVHPQGLVLEDPGLMRQGAERTLVGGREPLTGGSRAAWLEPETMDQMIDRLRRFGFSD